jgi:FdhE protein
MTRDMWLERHPYLQPVADVHAIVEATATGIEVPTAPIPDWNQYAADFHAGVPLLKSSTTAFDFASAEPAVHSLIRRLASASLPEPLAMACRDIEAELETPDPRSPAHPGLLRYLGWVVLVRSLAPVVSAFDTWRDEERWLRNYCPTCGEPPAMGQLVGKDPGRLRKLSCGRCRTRWRYRRTACPFCDSQDDHRLTALVVQDEAGLRIDYCDVCNGYLKTYDGEGSESVLLADWTSLHLDLIARDRGLKRLAASLYDLDAH